MVARKARFYLAVIWVVPALALIGFCVIQLSSDNLVHLRDDGFGWLLPLLMPVVGLILGGMGADVFAGREESQQHVYRTAFFLAAGCSAFYLILLCYFVFGFTLEFAAGRSSEIWVTRVQGWEKWIGTLQGAVAAYLGYFFVAPSRK